MVDKLARLEHASVRVIVEDARTGKAVLTEKVEVSINLDAFCRRLAKWLIDEAGLSLGVGLPISSLTLPAEAGEHTVEEYCRTYVLLYRAYATMSDEVADDDDRQRWVTKTRRALWKDFYEALARAGDAPDKKSPLYKVMRDNFRNMLNKYLEDWLAREKKANS